jgi:hypothetical protein
LDFLGLFVGAKKNPLFNEEGGFLQVLSLLKSNEVVPLVGVELTTYRLQGGCSTN